MKNNEDMSSSIRSRSVSRSRVIKKSDLFPGGEALDPYVLLEDVLKNLNSTDVPLSVKLSDGNNTVVFILSTFLSKDYEVVNGKVTFGFRKLDVDSLRAKIEFDIGIESSGD
jgi:hypothetical protein